MTKIIQAVSRAITFITLTNNYWRKDNMSYKVGEKVQVYVQEPTTSGLQSKWTDGTVVSVLEDEGYVTISSYSDMRTSARLEEGKVMVRETITAYRIDSNSVRHKPVDTPYRVGEKVLLRRQTIIRDQIFEYWVEATVREVFDSGRIEFEYEDLRTNLFVLRTNNESGYNIQNAILNVDYRNCSHIIKRLS